MTDARACIARDAALAVGDGANDLAMIRAAIRHDDLTALLYLQDDPRRLRAIPFVSG